MSVPLSFRGRSTCQFPHAAQRSSVSAAGSPGGTVLGTTRLSIACPCVPALPRWKGTAHPQRCREGSAFALLCVASFRMLWDPRCSCDSLAKVKLLLGILGSEWWGRDGTSRRRDGEESHWASVGVVERLPCCLCSKYCI